MWGGSSVNLLHWPAYGVHDVGDPALRAVCVGTDAGLHRQVLVDGGVQLRQVFFPGNGEGQVLEGFYRGGDLSHIHTQLDLRGCLHHRAVKGKPQHAQAAGQAEIISVNPCRNCENIFHSCLIINKIFFVCCVSKIPHELLVGLKKKLLKTNHWAVVGNTNQ